MFKFFRNHPKVIIGIGIAVILITILSVYQKQQYLKHPYGDQIGNPARASESLEDTFYYDQLTEKEVKAYDVLKQAIENMQGGLITFPEGLTGTEYSRVTQALECGQEDYFYAMIEIPMTDKNQNVNYTQSNILNVTDDIITQCILFLYPAEGLDISGEIDDDGYVTNLDELAGPLSEMDPEKTAKVEELQEESDRILNEVVASLPAEYGTKEAIDYFLDWMDNNLTLDEELMEDTSSLKTMSEVFERVYFESHRSCVVEGTAMAAGYTKVLTYLCNQAGIDAHVVVGSWKSSNAYTMVCVDFEGTPVFIDASGYKNDDLWDQRYISQTLATRYLTSIDYFDSVK